MLANPLTETVRFIEEKRDRVGLSVSHTIDCCRLSAERVRFPSLVSSSQLESVGFKDSSDWVQR